VFALESHKHKTMLVGEDLGTVPPEVPRAMARHNVHRMYVVQYELSPDPQAALPEPPASSIASINTHDMPPLAGYWQNRDLDEREAANLLPENLRRSEEETRDKRREAVRDFLEGAGYLDSDATPDAIRDAIIAYLADSPARLVILNLEDLWNETTSQNVPSSQGERANWQRKARLALEDFKSDAAVLGALRKFAAKFTHGYDQSDP
jgi:4-alpha-glucanotransferase